MGPRNWIVCAFQEALDDIAADENAGAHFSIKILKQYLDRGVELLAENEIHPGIARRGIPHRSRSGRATDGGRIVSPAIASNAHFRPLWFSKADPTLREPTPKTIAALTLADVKDYYAKRFPARHDNDYGDRRHYSRRSEARVREMVWGMESGWSETGRNSARRASQWSSGRECSRSRSDYRTRSIWPRKFQSIASLPITMRFSWAIACWAAASMLRVFTAICGKKLGMCTTSITHCAPPKHALFIRSLYGCDPDNVSKARLLVEQDIAAKRTTNVTDAELQQAKALLLRRDDPQRIERRNRSQRDWWPRALVGLPLDEPFRAAQKYYALSADDIRAAFQKWIRPDALVQVVRGPAPGKAFAQK